MRVNKRFKHEVLQNVFYLKNKILKGGNFFKEIPRMKEKNEGEAEEVEKRVTEKKKVRERKKKDKTKKGNVEKW